MGQFATIRGLEDGSLRVDDNRLGIPSFEPILDILECQLVSRNLGSQAIEFFVPPLPGSQDSLLGERRLHPPWVR